MKRKDIIVLSILALLVVIIVYTYHRNLPGEEEREAGGGGPVICGGGGPQPEGCPPSGGGNYPPPPSGYGPGCCISDCTFYGVPSFPGEDPSAIAVDLVPYCMSQNLPPSGQTNNDCTLTQDILQHRNVCGEPFGVKNCYDAWAALGFDSPPKCSDRGKNSSGDDPKPQPPPPPPPVCTKDGDDAWSSGKFEVCCDKNSPTLVRFNPTDEKCHYVCGPPKHDKCYLDCGDKCTKGVGKKCDPKCPCYNGVCDPCKGPGQDCGWDCISGVCSKSGSMPQYESLGDCLDPTYSKCTSFYDAKT